jgi:ABC-type phosphate transport system substrate-binding protein
MSIPDLRRRKALLYRRFLSVIAFVLASVSLLPARDLAVVSNKSNALSSISVPELIRVCKAQMSRWPDGKPMIFVMRPPSDPEMKVFLEKVYGMTEGEVRGLIAASNRARVNQPAILIVNSDEELVNQVASLPGSIGIVDVYSINSSIVVVKVAGKLPLEPGYLLHASQ